jgi:hypothetical protein
MTQVDILGMGTQATISGQTTKETYEGLLFSAKGPRSATFPDNFLLVDVKTMEGNHVTEFHNVSRFKEDSFDPGTLKGEQYLIVENKPLFGHVLPMDDIKG